MSGRNPPRRGRLPGGPRPRRHAEVSSDLQRSDRSIAPQASDSARARRTLARSDPQAWRRGERLPLASAERSDGATSEVPDAWTSSRSKVLEARAPAHASLGVPHDRIAAQGGVSVEAHETLGMDELRASPPTVSSLSLCAMSDCRPRIGRTIGSASKEQPAEPGSRVGWGQEQCLTAGSLRGGSDSRHRTGYRLLLVPRVSSAASPGPGRRGAGPRANHRSTVRSLTAAPATITDRPLSPRDRSPAEDRSD
jgi:hypothetical protein